MINLHDIGTAIAELLKSAGHTVTAAEVDEGFDRPTFFIDIFQNSQKRENPFMETVNVGAELRYFPETETRAAQVEMADKLAALLTREPLQVKDRRLTVQELSFDTDNAALLTEFELEFSREPAAEPTQYSQMAGLVFRIGIRRG